jgi:FAD:protein FMN transferase
MSDREAEARVSFDCFGSRCEALVTGPGESRTAEEAADLCRRRMLDWHERFSRFLPDSELSRLNRDPAPSVAVSRDMARFARAVGEAGELTGGLVDATLLADIQRAGYTGELGPSVPLARALALAPARSPAHSAESRGWQQIEADGAGTTVTRPPGTTLDSGGIAKGLFADMLAEMLASHASFAVNCAGDLALGGTLGAPRRVDVASPLDGSTIHTFMLTEGGVATSGIGRRSWLDQSGNPAHHLLDPATGRPAFTGIVQATALAPSALEAEALAKAALLTGPARASGWMRHGGVIVLDDGSHRIFQPPLVITLSKLPAHAYRRQTALLQDA